MTIKPGIEASMGRLAEVSTQVTSCRKCPRLVEWREQCAADPPRRFRGHNYWARPVASFGDAGAAIVLVGLAPAAHGGNRTGRIFTGDRSGDWLFAALHRTGFANQPESIGPGDGLALRDAWVSAVVRCAPPANKPTPEERDTCLPYLVEELGTLTQARVIVALGSFGWDGALRALADLSVPIPSPKPKFGHGAEARVGNAESGEWTLLGCFHPSQQNTFTGRLTEPMTDEVLNRARDLAGL